MGPVFTRYIWTKSAVLGFQFGLLASSFLLLAATINGLTNFGLILIKIHVTLISGSVLNAIGEYLVSSIDSNMQWKQGIQNPPNPYICAVCAFIGNLTGSIAPFASKFIPFVPVVGAVVLVVSLELIFCGFIVAVLGKIEIKNNIIRVLVIGWITITVVLCTPRVVKYI